MRQETFTCDICGAVKETTNHWWKLGIDRATENKQLAILPFNDDWEPEDYWEERFDLCGESCVLKQVSEFMGRK